MEKALWFIVNHCIPINPRTNDIPIIDTPHVNDVPHHRQPARQRKRQLHSVWAHAVTKTPCPAGAHSHTGKVTQVRAQTEPLTRQ
ncbi:MAG: hypothetical protein IKQ52_09135 [Bacteroidales bacterium]|nr:hypothetical protein [Bacteroidales bacterium]MBR6905017.1 hypothetical protein [Bacteroidales bacterium]